MVGFPSQTVYLFMLGGNCLIPLRRRGVPEGLILMFAKLRHLLPYDLLLWSEVIPRRLWPDNSEKAKLFEGYSEDGIHRHLQARATAPG